MKWLRELEADGNYVPILNEEPALDNICIFYINSFYILSNDRQSGFGIGSIPMQSMLKYLDELGYDQQQERLDFLHFIQFLDSEFVKFHRENKPAEKKDGDTKHSHRSIKGQARR